MQLYITPRILSTVLVCRNKATRKAVCPSFIVNGNVIPESDNVKYLGHIICSDLSDDEDMMRQMRYICPRECSISKFSYVFDRC